MEVENVLEEIRLNCVMALVCGYASLKVESRGSELMILQCEVNGRKIKLS